MLTQSTSTSLSFPTPYPTPHLPHSAENVVFFTLALDFFFYFLGLLCLHPVRITIEKSSRTKNTSQMAFPSLIVRCRPSCACTNFPNSTP